MTVAAVSLEGPLATRAPAKINLTLAVTGRRADGYHLLDSLVAFARVGDELSLEAADATSLVVRGPTATAAGDPAANLVLRAVAELALRVPGLRAGRFRLVKRLPVAAGLGGGSSDAGAALRLLARLNGLSPGDERVRDAARATGSDVPVCLDATARRMTGTGDILSKAMPIAAMPAILVNPRVATPTGPVFKALGLAPGSSRAGAASIMPEGLDTRKALLELLHAAGNDLEAPAVSLEPVVGDALAEVRKLPGCRLARMSGSGATVFGLFDSCRSAAGAAKALRAARPDWWIVTTMIG